MRSDTEVSALDGTTYIGRHWTGHVQRRAQGRRLNAARGNTRREALDGGSTRREARGKAPAQSAGKGYAKHASSPFSLLSCPGCLAPLLTENISINGWLIAR
jgi:hypothetical protein